MSISYRPEIDGLRAIAVVAVILYHAGFVVAGSTLLAGGFIGVDVFFVISGYLITAIILKELQAGHFSFLRFYERRARRILPALFLMMTVTLPLGMVLMDQQAMREFTGSALASLGFGANILFWLQDSYTAEPSALKPLLHTWSLSIEEQFYMLFPVALLLVYRLDHKALLPVLSVALLMSLGLSHYGSSQFPSATFFLLPTRAWELLAGAALASLETRVSRHASPVLRSVLVLVGLLLIGASFVMFDDDMRHPSLLTTLPVAGTMLVIWFANKDDRIYALLCARPVVATGLVSYSLYLWHFPVFAFARIENVFDSNASKLLFMALSVLLALLAWQLVEKPLRNRALINVRALTRALTASAAVLVAGFSLAHMDSIRQLQSFALDGRYFNIDEEKTKRYEVAYATCGTWELDHCYRPQPDKINILIVGDSMAVDVSNSVAALYPDYHFAHSSLGGCPPYPNIAELVTAGHPDIERCIELNAARFAADAMAGYDGVIIKVQLSWFTPENLRRYLDQLSAAGMRNVMLLGNYIELNRDFPEIISEQASQLFAYGTLKSTPYIENEFVYEDDLGKLASAFGYEYISMREHLCESEGCPLFADGYPFTWDKIHFSREFAGFVAAKIQPALAGTWLHQLSENQEGDAAAE